MYLPYKILAEMTISLHFLWILFLIFGAFAGVRNKFAKIAHFSGLVFALVIQIFGWYCPLTYLEVWLRQKYEPVSAYKGPFITHYLEKIIYIELPQGVITALTILLLVLNVRIYSKKRTPGK